MDRKTSSLLFDEHPLVILPELATRIGLNNAIVVQQVHYWLTNKAKSVKEQDLEKEHTYREGKFWTYDSYKSWQKQFPFWGVKTVERTFIALEDQGILISKKFNKLKADNTKWYTIDYEALDNYVKPKRKSKHDKNDSSIEETQSEHIGDDDVNVDVEHDVNLTKCAVEHDVNLTKPPRQVDEAMTSSCRDHDVNLTRPIPETSSEIPSETSVGDFSKSSSSSFNTQGIDADLSTVDNFVDKSDEEDMENISGMIRYLGQQIAAHNLMPTNQQIQNTLNMVIERGLLFFDEKDVDRAVDHYIRQCEKTKITMPPLFFVNGLEMKINERHSYALGSSIRKERERIESMKPKVKKIKFYNWLEDRD